MILLIALDTYYNFRFFSVRDEGGKRPRLRASARVPVYASLSGECPDLAEYGICDDAGLYGVQVLFFLLYIYLTRLFYRNSSKLLVNNMYARSWQRIYYPDKTESRPGDASVCDRCGGSSRDMDHPVHHRPGVAACHVSVGLRDPGACASRRGVRDRKYFLRSPALPDVRGFTVQPSEFVKISFVFFVAAIFYQSTDRDTIIKTTVVAAVHVLVLVLSKDLGSALIFSWLI